MGAQIIRSPGLAMGGECWQILRGQEDSLTQTLPPSARTVTEPAAPLNVRTRLRESGKRAASLPWQYTRQAGAGDRVGRPGKEATVSSEEGVDACMANQRGWRLESRMSLMHPSWTRVKEGGEGCRRVREERSTSAAAGLLLKSQPRRERACWRGRDSGWGRSQAKEGREEKERGSRVRRSGSTNWGVSERIKRAEDGGDAERSLGKRGVIKKTLRKSRRSIEASFIEDGGDYGVQGLRVFFF